MGNPGGEEAVMNAIKIRLLKRRARALYQKIHSADDWSCGAAIADHIRPGIAEAEREFATVMAELRAIDSSAPAAQ